MKKQPPLSAAVSLLVCLFILSPVFVLAGTGPGILMTIDDVERVIDRPDWVVLDCRTKKLYDAGHIRGAVTLGDSCRFILKDGTQRIKPVRELEEVFGNAGIDNNKHVVVYADAKNLDHATIGFWALEYLGHDRAHFLNGCFDEWKKRGKPVDKDVPQVKNARFNAKVNASVIATTDEILAIVKRKTKDVQLVDSRSENEYAGLDIRSLRGGRLPHTTLNVPETSNYDKKTGVIYPDKLLPLYSTLDRDKRTISYCQTGARSTVTYLAMRLLGFKNPAVYDDSWIVYGNSVNPPYPVENEQWINLDVLEKMKKAIDKMAKEISELKKMNAQLTEDGTEQGPSVKDEVSWMNPLEESGCGFAEE
ncbi:MAG: sulfurtransferase [Nitrospiraceae bacterium]|nr:MAG: sulfurtransferase [Nitrospiraceae bacterium]